MLDEVLNAIMEIKNINHSSTYKEKRKFEKIDEQTAITVLKYIR
jgi:hypothetical protein